MPDEIAPGLWRWVAPHPEWQPTEEDGTPTSWPREVGCVLYETASHAVLFDPLAPEDDAGFWRWADERCRGREAVVLETIHYHRRSREKFLARYGAATAVPDGVVPFALAAFDETVYWIAEHRALVPGDSLVGAGDGELRLCPASWLARGTLDELRAALASALLGLDVELVAVSHGEPALRGGGAALARALQAP